MSSVRTTWLVGVSLILTGCSSTTPSSPAPAPAPVVFAPPPTVTSVVLTSSLPMGGNLPQVPRGTMVTFGATASGGTPPIEFRFKGNGITLRGWSTEPTFTWDAKTDADGQVISAGRIYFWVDTRSGGRAAIERSSETFQFDVLECQGLARFTPTCFAAR